MLDCFFLPPAANDGLEQKKRKGKEQYSCSSCGTGSVSCQNKPEISAGERGEGEMGAAAPRPVRKVSLFYEVPGSSGHLQGFASIKQKSR